MPPSVWTMYFAWALFCGWMFSTMRKMVWLQLETPITSPGDRVISRRWAARLADARHDRAIAVSRTFDDDDLARAEAVADRRFEIGIGAGRRDDRGAHDILRLGTLQHARDGGLRQVQVLGDLRLALVFQMIHLRNAGDQPKFVNASHMPCPVNFYSTLALSGIKVERAIASFHVFN